MPNRTDSLYEWLESQEAPECLEWVESENALTTAKLDSLAQTKYVQKRLKEIVSSQTKCPDYWVAGNLFRLRKDESNERGVLEVAEKAPNGAFGSWKPVVDFDELSRQEGKKLGFSSFGFQSRVLTPDGSRILLLLSDGGSELVELREVDIKERKLVQNGFRAGVGRIAATWLDQDHILINHALNRGATTATGFPRTTYIWKRGTDLQDAKAVYTAPETDAMCLLGSLGSSSNGCAILSRIPDFSSVAHMIVSLDGSVEEVELPKKVARLMEPKVAAGHLIVSLEESTDFLGHQLPAGALVSYNTSPGVSAEDKLSVVYIPESEEFAPFVSQGGFEASQTKVHLVVTKKGKQRRLVLENHENVWKVVVDQPTPVGGHVTIISADGQSDHTIISESGLLRPTTVRLDGPDGTIQNLFSQTPLVDAGKFSAETQVAYSEDGTDIEYFVLSPRSSKGDLKHGPVLMTGYGGFGMTVSTTYFGEFFGGFSLVPWLESGGSLVFAFIRGGGERGPAWHEAGRQEKRLNSYQDFIAVAKKLINDGITTPKELGVFGASNGGLLAAVAGTQRPDLFRAVVSDVPVTDMLRFPLMGMGVAWKHEFGDPDDTEMAKVLRSYSPFHNVHTGVQYPAFLVTTSTKDDRLGAGHARKLVAKLKDEGSVDSFLFENDDGGHGFHDPIKDAALMSRRMGFFLYYLDLVIV